MGRFFLVVTLCACGGAPSSPSAPALPPPPPDAPAAPDAGTGEAASTSPTSAECAAMVDHVIALVAAEQPGVTEKDRAAVHTRLAAYAPECQTTLTRAQVECGRAAPDLAAALACQGP